MNAFRIFFLVLVIVGGLALAMTQTVPRVVSDQNQEALVDRARMESVVVGHVEELHAVARARFGESVAAHPAVAAALTNAEGADAASALRAALQAAPDDGLRAPDALVLVDADGAALAHLGGPSTVDANTWAARTRAAEATGGDTTLRTYFGLMGRLYASAVVPVHANGRAVGGVVVVEEYDHTTIASRRSGVGANSAFFVGRDVIASNLVDDAISEDVQSVVEMTSAGALGGPGRLVLQELRGYDDRVAVIAPVRLGRSAQDYAAGAPNIGVVIVVEGPRTPQNLPAVLAQMRVFDDGTGGLWLAIVMCLIVFFGGLAMLDWSLGRGANDMARQIRESATANDPLPLRAADFPSWIRVVAEAHNSFLEAYRNQTPTARKSRQESAAHLFMVDNTSKSHATIEPGPRLPSGSHSQPLPATATSERSSTVNFDSASGTSVKTPLLKASDEGHGLLRLDSGEHVSVGDQTNAPLSTFELEDSVSRAVDLSALSEASEPVPVTTHAEPEPAPTFETEDSDPISALDDTESAEPAAPVSEDLGVLSGAEAAIDEDWAALMEDVEKEISGANQAVSAPAPEARGLDLGDEIRPAAVPRSVSGPVFAAPSMSGEQSPIDDAEEDDEPMSLRASDTEPPVPTVPHQDPVPTPMRPVPPAPEARTRPAAPVFDEATEGGLRAAEEFVSDLEREGDTGESLPPMDPQKSQTVPRVSLEDLAERARESGSDEPTDQASLLAAAEERLRALRPDSSGTDDAVHAQRPLYEAFRAAKERAGDDVSRLTFERFLTKLDRNRTALMERYSCRDVRFEVNERDGKVTLKATPLR